MDHLFWIRERALPPQNEDDAIYREVVARAPDISVAIYQGAEIDPELTAASGRNRYRNAPMLCKRNVGEKDFVSEPLADEHRIRFPRAWAWWQAQKEKAARVSIELLPGISPADVAELRDLGIGDVETLVTKEVPVELSGWKDISMRLRGKPRLRLVDGVYQEVA